MSASPPSSPQPPRNSLSVLRVCQQDRFGNELLQVNEPLVTQLDPRIRQCSNYSSPQYKAAKGYKSYDTDKGRFLWLSAHVRAQTCHGCLVLSRKEQITILFLMAVYRPDKEGRSSEPVADPIETCSANEQSDSDTLHQPATPDYIMNRHDLSSDDNLVEEIYNKISLIKDNVSKYFTAEFDAGRDCYYYYNNLLTGQDYTDENTFINLIPKITTKTKPAPVMVSGQGKSKGRSTLKKRRTTISQTPINRNIAPHLASAENQQIREISTEPVALDNGNLAVYPEHPTPSYDEHYQMDQYSTTDFTHGTDFSPIQQISPMPNIAYQGPGAYGPYGTVDSDHLYNTINMLIKMFEGATGLSYSEVHARQLSAEMNDIFTANTMGHNHHANMSARQVTVPAHPRQQQGFPQFAYPNNNNMSFNHQHQPSSG